MWIRLSFVVAYHILIIISKKSVQIHFIVKSGLNIIDFPKKGKELDILYIEMFIFIYKETDTINANFK